MHVGKLNLPADLVALINSGRWPRTEAEVQNQNLISLVPAQVVQVLAPGENAIVLYAPPFRTIQDMLDDGHGLSAEQLAIHDIVPNRTVPIADFGLATDTSIAFDYRDDPAAPTVIRLRWERPGQPNRWLRVADTFEQFWKMLDID